MHDTIAVAMVATLDFELITPDGILIHEPISKVVAHSESGEIGILANHANLKSKLKSAPLRYVDVQGQQNYIAVLGGIIEVKNNKITILTDFAEKGSDINVAEAHKAADKARAEIQTLSPKARREDKELLIAETQLQRELLRIQTAQLFSKNI